MTEVLGWRVDDAVGLIRGTENSVVMLEVLAADAGPDGKPKRIPLTRKKISLEEQSAKKAVYSVTDGKSKLQVGVIALPSFYEDFEARRRGDPNYKSAARDVARLLDELKKEKKEFRSFYQNIVDMIIKQEKEITGKMKNKEQTRRHREKRNKTRKRK